MEFICTALVMSNSGLGFGESLNTSRNC